MLMAVGIGFRMILPRGIWTDFFADLLHSAVLGIWHVIFGPPKVRVVRPRKRRRWRI
jgi:hypothetical protein